MPGISEVGVLMGLMGSASEYLEYWRTYKGQRIAIREKETDSGEDKRGSVKQTTTVIEGQVEDVLSLPPGFMLSDVIEYVQVSDFSMNWTIDDTEMHSVNPAAEGKQVVRKVDQKFVSFSKIHELEPADASNSAVEPFREEQDDS